MSTINCCCGSTATWSNFEGGTAYDADEVFGDRSRILPQTSDDDPGDLAPAGIGAADAKLTVTRLQVWRDIYYIADSWERNRGGDLVTDFDHPLRSAAARIAVRAVAVGLVSPNASTSISRSAEDQFFVMGDNSAESSDARLWRGDDPHAAASPAARTWNGGC